MDTILTAIAAFLLAGFVKGVLGFGFPLIALVVLTLATGLLDALAIIMIPTLATNVVQALSGTYLREIMQRMGLYFVVSMSAVFATSFFIIEINVNWLTALLGAVLFFFALSRLFEFHLSVPRELERVLSIVLGAINGTLTGFTGSFMVPSVLYMQALGFHRDMLIQAMGTFFALSTLMLALSLGRNDLISADQAMLSLAALVPSFIGVYAGRRVRNKVDEQQFKSIFLVGVLLIGAYVSGRSIVAIY